MKGKFARQYCGDNVKGSIVYADAKDPQYKEWSLAGLIAVGWGDTLMNAVQPFLDKLVLGEDDRKDPSKVSEADAALEHIQNLLSGIVPED